MCSLCDKLASVGKPVDDDEPISYIVYTMEPMLRLYCWSVVEPHLT
jgi:hypothetical protein